MSNPKRKKKIKLLKSYNTIPIITFLLLIGMCILTMFNVENWDNKILFFVAFVSLAYLIVTNLRIDEEKYSPKRIEHIKANSTEALKIELNKKLEELRKEKCVAIDIHIVDAKNALIIVTD